MQIKRYLDVSLVVAGAPVLLVLGVPAIGYGVAAGTWILVRLLGVAVDRQVEAKLSYRLIRIVALGRDSRGPRGAACQADQPETASILVVSGVGRADGLTTALVLALAFTMQLVCAAPLPGPPAHTARLHAYEAAPGAQPTIKVLPKE